MILKGDSFKEEIVGGVSSEFILSDHNAWKFTVPAQFLAYHQGGQIDVLSRLIPLLYLVAPQDLNFTKISETL
jgi:hypothetical protein